MTLLIFYRNQMVPPNPEINLPERDGYRLVPVNTANAA